MTGIIKAARVIGPDSKTITFKYDGDLLVSSTTPKEKYINTDMIMDY